MSLTDYLLESRSPLELAKELAARYKEIAHLKDRIHELEHEVFWTKATERNQDEHRPASIEPTNR